MSERRKTAIVPGAGLVLVSGDVRAVILRADGTDVEELGAFLQICRDAGAAPDDVAATVTARVGHLLNATGPADFPAFAVVAPSAMGGTLALLHGDIDLVAGRTDGTEVRVSGRAGAVWTQEELGTDIRDISVAPYGHDGRPDLWTDLESGLAHGAGFRWMPVGLPAPTAIEEPSASASDLAAVLQTTGRNLGVHPVTGEDTTSTDAAPEFQPVSLVGVDTDAALAGRQPLGIDGIPADPGSDADDDLVIVKGIRCARDHHNDPRALYCSRCGIKIVKRTHELVDGVRPPLGVLTFDDGATYAVKRDIVIGREPGADDLVVSDSALAVVIVDDQRTVSRAHAYIKLIDWDVFLEDRGSANGTFIRTAPHQPWQRIRPDERVALSAGMSVRIGERELVFDQHQLV